MAWWGDEAESQNTIVLLPHRSGSLPNSPSIPQFYEAPGYGHDKYQRTIGDVILPDGTNVNHVLVETGWCWWY